MGEPPPNTNSAAKSLRYTEGNPYVRLRPIIAVDSIRDPDGSFQGALCLADDSPDLCVLLHAYKNFTSIMRMTFGIRPGVTIGSTAMRAFLTTLPETHVHYRQSKGVDKLAREAYFGGLTFVRTMKEQYN